MIQYIAASVLGLSIYWTLELSRAWRRTQKTKMPFYWNKFISDNLINFIVTVLYASSFFLIADISYLKTISIPYILFVRMDTLIFFIGGMAGSNVINQIIKLFTTILKAKENG